MSAPYPWLESEWMDLQSRLRSGAMGHAYLLSGREGLGKLALAESFARAVLCEDRLSGGGACSQCRSCVLFASGSHPDLKRLARDQDHKGIVIDQVRELINYYTLKSHYGGFKLTIICPAETMNTAAANALLKVLEEPPVGALILLVAHRPALLPSTVRSRCQQINVEMPPFHVVEDWLAGQDRGDANRTAIGSLTLMGAPLDVARQLESGAATLLNDLIGALEATAARRRHALEAARDFAEIEVEAFINALETLLQALILLRVGHRRRRLRVPQPQLESLQEISNKLNFKRLFLYFDEVAFARSMVLRSSGVRGAEIIENLWLGWTRAILTENTV